MIRYGSVCSGIEAASVAWHPLGWKAEFFSEIEKFPRQVLQYRWPGVPLHGDFTTIKEDSYGPIQLLVGGTPCQSFSVAGLRKGMADPRGNLALGFLGLAAATRPKWVVWENVPGVLSSNGGRDFGAFLGGLGQLGYGWAYRVLDAQYFGVAQRRRRVFVVGCLGSWQRAAAVLFERQSLCGDSPPRRKARQGVTGGFETGPTGGSLTDLAPTMDARCKDGPIRNQLGVGVNHAHADEMTGGGQMVARPLLSASQRLDPLTDNFVLQHGGNFEVANTLRGEGFDASEDGTGRQNLVPIVAPTIEATAGRSRGVAYPINTQIALRHEALGEGTGLGIGSPDDPCFTLQENHHHAVGVSIRGRDGGGTAELAEGAMPALRASQGGGDKPHVLIPDMAVRRLTPRECERLQGFPDDYTLIPINAKGGVSADGPRYKALGNSMAVPVMRWIGERIQLVEDMDK